MRGKRFEGLDYYQGISIRREWKLTIYVLEPDLQFFLFYCFLYKFLLFVIFLFQLFLSYLFFCLIFYCPFSSIFLLMWV
jgi:hypothetical protein